MAFRCLLFLIHRSTLNACRKQRGDEKPAVDMHIHRLLLRTLPFLIEALHGPTREAKSSDASLCSIAADTFPAVFVKESLRHVRLSHPV